MNLDHALARPPTLLTERLRLRAMALSDAAAVFEFKSDPSVTVCYGQEPHRSMEETITWVEKRLPGRERPDSIFWALTERGRDQAIGECCLWNFDPAFRCAEIGYELHRSYWQKGLMTEALSAVLAFGFDSLGLGRIEALPLAANERSQNLLLKLGFEREDILEKHIPDQGGSEVQVRFGLMDRDWMEGHRPIGSDRP
jgi:ribosomal-protein-alanine N-acetyltransferase